MKWEIVIGLETHAQLSTASKMFSGASTAFGASPNTQASAVDIALPGVLPVANKAAVERAIRFGLAIGATINQRSVFARKNYFYPDLPKGYQISQYESPIVQGGKIPIETDASAKNIRLVRAHLEEDTGKSFHGEAISGVVGQGVAGVMTVGVSLVDESRDLTKLSAIDLNRAGTPLLEIVSEPDLRSAKEAVAYAKKIHEIVVWNNICDGNMQEGSFRFDANVSVRRPGAPLGRRAEIKNLNSFRFLERAIEFEAKRQIEILEDGGKIVQETRLYDADKDETRSMRTKEDAHDYRYFPDPDLLPLEVSNDWLERVRAGLPEQPQVKRERYQQDYGLTAYDAAVLTGSRSMAYYYEETVRNLVILGAPEKEASKLSASWLTGEILNWLNTNQVDIGECGLSSKWLASLLIRVQDQTISRSAARAILPGMWAIADGIRSGSKAAKEFSVDEIIVESGLKQISDSGAIEKIVDQVLAANPKQVEDYRAGKGKAFNSLVGQVMKATQGKANPAQVNEILKRKLAG